MEDKYLNIKAVFSEVVEGTFHLEVETNCIRMEERAVLLANLASKNKEWQLIFDIVNHVRHDPNFKQVDHWEVGGK